MSRRVTALSNFVVFNKIAIQLNQGYLVNVHVLSVYQCVYQEG